MAKKYLVTGGSGFIGGNLSRELASRGFEVIAFYRKGDDTRLIDGLKNIEKIEGDICDQKRLEEAMIGCDAVLHTAGNMSFRECDRPLLYRVNVGGTRAVVEASKYVGIKRLIHVSSINALGIPYPQGSLGNENTPFNWHKSGFYYAITKKIGEEIALSANNKTLETVSVNPGTVFGAGDVNFNAGSYIKAIASYPVLFYPGGGTNCVHVKSVVAGIILALDKGTPGERYILGGENLTYKEIFSTIAEVLKKPKPFIKIPYPLALTSAFAVERISEKTGIKTRLSASAVTAGELKLFYSSDKAVRELSLPFYTFKNAVEDAVAWYREQKLL